jgi:hypothetical protein
MACCVMVAALVGILMSGLRRCLRQAPDKAHHWSLQAPPSEEAS